VFERFTERARQVVVLAQEEARLLKHNYIGTEHLLLGLLREEDGVAATALTQLGITVEHVRSQIARIVGVGDAVTTGQIPFTPRAKKALELALREALGLGHNYIGTEHILLGVVRDDGGVANRILLEFDADAEKVRNAIIEILGIDYPPVAPLKRRFRRGRSEVFVRSFPRWEYRVEEHELEQEWLNELGAEGWELVAATGTTLVFKRRLQAPGLRAAG
jgi:ATP-dependent Clp protease ATP-binding subunit ClpA